MTTDINKLGADLARARPQTGITTTKVGTPPQARTQASTADKVAFSSETQLLKKTQQELDTMPEINQNRVAEVREQLANGSFKINTAKIAEKIINEQI